MIATKICGRLLENADAPIRYRVARELLKDIAGKVQGTPVDYLENTLRV